MKPEPDPVERPPHYNTGEVECIEAIESMLSADEYRGYLRATAFAYRWRYRHKNGIEDLKKAAWYENRLLDFEIGQQGADSLKPEFNKGLEPPFNPFE